jgi:hypothetical protein
MRHFLTAAFLVCAATAALAAPARVIILRHGEKPPSGSDLDAQGVCRADALATVFPAKFGTPAAIYAMNPNDADGSMRPIETVTPLARALGLTIDHDYTRKQFSRLVSDIMGDAALDGKLVLICWEHKAIPDLAQSFAAGGWNEGSAVIPAKWSGSDFDSAWILNFSGSPSFQLSAEDVPADQLQGTCPAVDVQSPAPGRP